MGGNSELPRRIQPPEERGGGQKHGKPGRGYECDSCQPRTLNVVQIFALKFCSLISFCFSHTFLSQTHILFSLSLRVTSTNPETRQSCPLPYTEVVLQRVRCLVSVQTCRPDCEFLPHVPSDFRDISSFTCE